VFDFDTTPISDSS